MVQGSHIIVGKEMLCSCTCLTTHFIIRLAQYCGIENAFVNGHVWQHFINICQSAKAEMVQVCSLFNFYFSCCKMNNMIRAVQKQLNGCLEGLDGGWGSKFLYSKFFSAIFSSCIWTIILFSSILTPFIFYFCPLFYIL